MTTPRTPDAIALGAIRSLSAVTVLGTPKTPAELRANLAGIWLIADLALAPPPVVPPVQPPPPVPPVTPPAPTPNPVPPSNPVGVPPPVVPPVVQPAPQPTVPAPVVVQPAPQPPASGSGALLVLEDFEHPSEAAFRASLPRLGARHPELLALDATVPFQGRASLRYEQPAGTKASPELHIRFAAPQSDVWLRAVVRWSPGWTTAGTLLNTANSYKLLGFSWSQGGRTPAGRAMSGRSTVEITNGTQYRFGGAYLPSAVPMTNIPTGRITTEWTDGGWYDYRIHYRRVDDRTIVLRHWRSRAGQAPVLVATVTLAADPRVAWARVPTCGGVFVGLNANQRRVLAQSLNVGLIEVWADGNPWGL